MKQTLLLVVADLVVDLDQEVGGQDQVMEEALGLEVEDPHLDDQGQDLNQEVLNLDQEAEELVLEEVLDLEVEEDLEIGQLVEIDQEVGEDQDQEIDQVQQMILD